MERTVAMPKLGMTMTEGVIVRWHVKPGDVVNKDDVLADVETDKVELEVEAPAAGRVLRLQGEEGETVPVGAPLLVLEAESAAGAFTEALTEALTGNATDSVQEPEPAPPTTAPEQEPLPVDGELDREAGADNATQTSSGRIPSTPAAKRIATERGVSLGEVAAATGRDVSAEPLRAADVMTYTRAAPAAQQPPTVELTPLARKLAEANALTPEEIARHAANGNGRRLGREAVAEALAARGVPPAPLAQVAPAVQATAPAPTPTPAHAAAPEGEELVALNSMRRAIAERTARSFTTTPHIYLDTEVDMTEAEALRETQAKAAAKQGASAPSVTAILVKVVAVALRRHPEVNAGFVPAREGSPAAIQRWRAVNVGVAVALPDGLLVPVIRDADAKSIPRISTELTELARRAREGKLLPDDLAGGTFSISNLGMYGIDTFHAVLNEPQAGILAVGKTTRRPVVMHDAEGNESLAIRPILKLSLSADHRVLDGATGARFVATVRELLEEPRLLI